MRKSSSFTHLPLFLLGLILTTSCARAPQEPRQEPAQTETHKVSKYTFPGVDLPTNDLHVEFDQENVKTKDIGPFDEAKTEGKFVNLKKRGSALPPNTNAELEFERDGDFNILKWWWTYNDTRVGDEHTGPPPS